MEFVLNENAAKKVQELIRQVEGPTGPSYGGRGGKVPLWVEVTANMSGVYVGTIQTTGDGGSTWTDHADDAIVVPANDGEALEIGRRYLGLRSTLEGGVWTVIVTTGGGTPEEIELEYLSDFTITNAVGTPVCDEETGELVSISIDFDVEKTYCTWVIKGYGLEVISNECD